MTISRRLLVILLAVVGCLNALRAETSVEVSLPRNAAAGSNFSITVSVYNPDGTVSTINPPQLQGCELVGGPQTSMQSSEVYTNGQRQRTTVRSWTYIYRAASECTVSVPAISVTVGSQSYQTHAGQFTVGPARQQQQQQQGGGYGYGGGYYGGGSSQSPGSQQSATQSRQAGQNFHVGGDELFMAVQLSNSTPYEQQAVECTVKLYSIDGQVQNIMASSTPTFDGCIMENLGTPKNIDWHQETYNGKNYYTAVIARSLLYPQRSGEIAVNGAEYDVRVYRQVYVQDFFSVRPVADYKEVKLKSRPATLHVKPLPSPRPADFSGAVGQFSAASKVVGTQFKTNEAATYIYTVSGTGNIKFLQNPTPDFPSEFEVYEPVVNNTAKVSGHSMTGTLTAEFTFVPQSVGKFAIGGKPFVYFDPQKGTYVTLPMETFEIDVKQGVNTAASVNYSNKQDIESKNTDIHHIKPGAREQAASSAQLARSPLYWLAYPLLVALLGVAMIVARRQIAARSDVKGRRLSKANKVARRRLARAGKLLKAAQMEAFYAELLDAMQGYLADKLSLGASQLSRDNVTALLSERGADEALLADLVNVINECEMARYTPQLSTEQAGEDYSRATSVIDRIESLTRKQ